MYGQKLRALRKREGWTQEEAASRLGVSKQTYSHYENENRRPSLDTIRKLAAIYRVDIDEIFAEEAAAPLSAKEERDIAVDLERMLSDLESNEALAFHGEAMDEESRKLLKISLENSLRIAKQAAKKKFAPHKYRPQS